MYDARFAPRREFESDGVRVVCDPMSYELLRGSRVQFEDSLMRRCVLLFLHWFRHEGANYSPVGMCI